MKGVPAAISSVMVGFSMGHDASVGNGYQLRMRSACRGANLAVGETVILLTPPAYPY